jgi:hypothetical protein
MFTITINAKTPEEFKEAVKGLYELFPDSPKSVANPGERQPESETKTGSVAGEKKVAPAASTTNAGAERPTIEAMRLAVTEFQQQGDEKRAILKNLFAQYNAKGVSSLDAANYAEFLTKLKAN